MTKPFFPFNWACKLLADAFMELIYLTHKAPLAPQSSFINKKTEPTIVQAPIVPEERVVSPVKVISTESQETVLMELNGHEYKFSKVLSENRIVIKKKDYLPVVTEHPKFGRKLLPTNMWSWVHVSFYEGLNVEDAVLEFIQSGLKHQALPLVQKPAPIETAKQVIAPVAAPIVKTDANELPKSVEKATIGKLLSMGDRAFADQQKIGKTYQNYAIGLEVFGRERVLQGEGLKDALAEVNAKIGDKISVLRLGQIQVPMIEKLSGIQKLDDDGHPKMVNKWLWKITVI